MQQLEAQITNQLRQKELPPNEQYELLQQLQQLRMLQQQASQLHPPNEPPPAQSLPVGDQLASFPPAPPPQQHQQQQPVNDQQQARQNILSLLQNSLATSTPATVPLSQPPFQPVVQQQLPPTITAPPTVFPTQPGTAPSYPNDTMDLLKNLTDLGLLNPGRVTQLMAPTATAPVVNPPTQLPPQAAPPPPPQSSKFQPPPKRQKLNRKKKPIGYVALLSFLFFTIAVCIDTSLLTARVKTW